MTPAEAAVLADKLKSSWPSSKITPEVWAEELLPLDAGRVGTAIVRLRRELEHPPSIVRFLQEYRALRTVGRPRDPFSHECDVCEDVGWVDAGHVQDDQFTRAGVKPCTCKAGQELEPVFGRIQAARPSHQGTPT